MSSRRKTEESEDDESSEDEGDETEKESESEEESPESDDEESEDEESEDEKKPRKKEKNVVLYPEQKPHFEKIKALLQNPLPYTAEEVQENAKRKKKREALKASRKKIPEELEDIEEDIMMYYIDRSPQGAGKTVIAMKIAQIFGFKIIIFCPTDLVKANWKKELSRYNMPTEGIFMYSELVGSASKKAKSYVPKSGLLRRDLTIKGKGKLTRTKKEEEEEAPKRFTPTKKLLRIIAKGTLFVFDEAETLKNKTLGAEACQAIIQAVGEYEDQPSRLAFLSGTIAETVDKLINVWKAVGIIKSPKLAMRIAATGEFRLYGAGDFFNFAKRWNFALTTQIMRKYERKWTNINVLKKAMFEVYDQVVQPAISSAMPQIDRVKKFNLFVNLEEADIEIVSGGAALMSKAIDYTISGGDGRRARGLIGKGLQKIEIGMSRPMVRKIKEFLEENPTRKVVFFYTFNEARDIIMKGLKKYKPLLIAGKQITSEEERNDNLDRFNKPNRKDRVIGVQLSVGSKGIQLDDKFGGFQHICCCMPTYFITRLLQAIARIGRADTKYIKDDPMSEPIAYVFYATNAPKFLTILDNLSKKTIVLEVTTKSEGGASQILPSSFPSIIEPIPEGEESRYPPMDATVNEKIREIAEAQANKQFTSLVSGKIEFEEDEDQEVLSDEDKEDEKERKTGKKSTRRKKVMED